MLLLIMASFAPLGSCSPPMKVVPISDHELVQYVHINFFVTTEPGRHELYVVQPDGRIGFGGGNDALLNRTSWDGAMSQAQADALRDVLVAHDLLDVRATGTGEPADQNWRVEIEHPGGRIRHRVTGRCDALEALRVVLADISRARLEGFLERLPLVPDEGDK
jgi:hypothetical protein